MNHPWQPLRLLLLAITFTGAIAVLGKTLIASKATTPATAATNLPTTIPLEKWQFSGRSALPGGNDLPIGQQFEYRQGDTPLTIQTRMMIGDGNVSRFLFVFTPIRAANANLQIKQKLDVGSYGVLTHQGRIYLTACVNPRGGSTVTEQQFMQNRYIYDLQPRRVLTWVLGQQPLLDQRCLWTLMSTPLPEGSSDPAQTEATLSTMETAWFSWYRWWQANFPPV